MARFLSWLTRVGIFLCAWSHLGLAVTISGAGVGATGSTASSVIVGKDGGVGGKIVCYYSSWSGYRPGLGSYSVDDIPIHLCTHVVYAFIGLNNRTWELLVLDPTNDITKGGYRRFTSLKKKNPGLKTMISVGGWVEGGRKYSELASRPERRRVFVNSVVDFLKWFNFDGLDLDWEFPGSADREGTPADKQNFVLLVQELREAFDKEGWGWLLTAVAPIMKFRVESGYDVEKLTPLLDHINLLTYDLRGNWTGFTDIHTPLRPRAFDNGDYEGVNMHDGAVLWENKGAINSKLMIGLAMYGRTYTLADPVVNGLRAPLSAGHSAGLPGPYTKANGTLSYYEICELQKAGGWSQKYDPVGDSVYITKGDQWIGFDDRQSLIEKVKFVKEFGFGGVAIWSLDLDDFRGVCGEKTILMNAIYKQMYGKSAQTAGPNFPKTSLVTAPPPNNNNAIGSFLHDEVTPRSEQFDPTRGPTVRPTGGFTFDTTTPRSLSIADTAVHLRPTSGHHFRSTVSPTFPVVKVATAAPPTSGFFAPRSTTQLPPDVNPNLLHEHVPDPATAAPDAVSDDVISRQEPQSTTLSPLSTERDGSAEKVTFGNVEDYSGTTTGEQNHFPSSISSSGEQATEAPPVATEESPRSAPIATGNSLPETDARDSTEHNEVIEFSTTQATGLDDLGLAGVFANPDEVRSVEEGAAALREPDTTPATTSSSTTTTTSTTPAPTPASSTKRSILVTRSPIRRKPGTRNFARPPKTITSEPPTSGPAPTVSGETATAGTKIKTKPFRIGATGNRRPPLRRRTTTTTTTAPRTNEPSQTGNDVTSASEQLQTSASRTAPPVRRFPPGRRLKIKSTTELFTELNGGAPTSRRTPSKFATDDGESASESVTDAASKLPNRGSSRFQSPGSLLTTRPSDDEESTAAPISLRSRVRVRPNGILGGRNRFNFPTTTTSTAAVSSSTSFDESDATLQSVGSDYRQIFVRFAPTPTPVRVIRNYAIRPRQLPRSVAAGGATNRLREYEGNSAFPPATEDPSAPACPLTRAHLAHRLCDKYWWCVHGKAVLRTCDMGLLWNPETASCDWAGDVVRNDCE